MSPITFLQVLIVMLGCGLLYLVIRLALKIHSAEEHNEAVRKQFDNEKRNPPPAS